MCICPTPHYLNSCPIHNTQLDSVKECYSIFDSMSNDPSLTNALNCMLKLCHSPLAVLMSYPFYIENLNNYDY